MSTTCRSITSIIGQTFPMIEVMEPREGDPNVYYMTSIIGNVCPPGTLRWGSVTQVAPTLKLFDKLFPKVEFNSPTSDVMTLSLESCVFLYVSASGPNRLVLRYLGTAPRTLYPFTMTSLKLSYRLKRTIAL